MSTTPCIDLTVDEMAQIFADAEREAATAEDTINESSEDYAYIFGRSHLLQ